MIPVRRTEKEREDGRGKGRKQLSTNCRGNSGEEEIERRMSEDHAQQRQQPKKKIET